MQEERRKENLVILSVKKIISKNVAQTHKQI